MLPVAWEHRLKMATANSVLAHECATLSRISHEGRSDLLNSFSTFRMQCRGSLLIVPLVLQYTTIFQYTVFRKAMKRSEQAKVDPELPATAATNGNIPVLEKLYRIGANVNKADSFGWTPLMLAQRLQNTNVESFLKKQIAWVHHDAATAATVELSDEGVKIRYTAATKCCVCTDKPLPAGLDCFYYEVTSHALLGEEGQSTYPIMALGFCTFGAQSYQFPGWPPKYTMQSGQSWAYHGDDGFICAGTFDRPRFGDKYGPGDTVGCGVNLETQKIWFTRSGRSLTSSIMASEGGYSLPLGLKIVSH